MLAISPSWAWGGPQGLWVEKEGRQQEQNQSPSLCVHDPFLGSWMQGAQELTATSQLARPGSCQERPPEPGQPHLAVYSLEDCALTPLAIFAMILSEHLCRDGDAGYHEEAGVHDGKVVCLVPWQVGYNQCIRSSSESRHFPCSYLFKPPQTLRGRGLGFPSHQ